MRDVMLARVREVTHNLTSLSLNVELVISFLSQEVANDYAS